MLASLLLMSALALTGCGPKDADIEKNVATAISAYPGVSVAVKDGVATISGQVPDESTRASVEAAAKGVKGVKSVSNNLTVPPPPPPPPPVTINPDETLQSSANQVLAGFDNAKGVKATVKDGVVTLTGTIKRADLPGLMQKLNEIKPKKVENKLVIK
ncbi:hypothetical protein FPE01S_04_05420 [Flavihumibacter petaseus NBRC 106054]|uniref:BON domain-containing protein n=2 Tax=Flavihumibacter TaxID=1004301 RepID=A0A0E9N666_9BACT|nr:hypothetical protein FPE01S_04_05420 [Flavihumibacter petaseus NBRC 106054]